MIVDIIGCFMDILIEVFLSDKQVLERHPDQASQAISQNQIQGEFMRIIVDDRETYSGVPEHLMKLDEAIISFKRLPLGDYLVDNRLLFERKTMQDFAMSLVDGRLFDQACRLASSTYTPAMILEGKISDLRQMNIRREALQGAIISLTVLFGIPLLRSLDTKETAHLMSYTSIQFHRNIRGSTNRTGYRPKGKRKRQLFILQGLPGIGPALAERLIQKFASVKAVFCASQAELSQVSGIGRKTAERIHKTVN